MSKWEPEKIKKRGLKAFTRSKFEYAIGKSMGMEVKEAVDMMMEIAENYTTHTIIKHLKNPKQRSFLFTQELIDEPEIWKEEKPGVKSIEVGVLFRNQLRGELRATLKKDEAND